VSPQRPDAERPAFRIAHVSDIHFGKIISDLVVPSLVDEINAGDFDVVVISGDLTQRAREREYRPAREMIDAMEAPVVVVPGNHDVPPWWRPMDRLFDAGGPFRKYISDDPTPTFTTTNEGQKLAVFGLDSSHGASIAGGRIRPRHVEAMSAFFADLPVHTFAVLTVHHPLKHLRAIGPHDVARGARRTLRKAGEHRVDLILSGHIHRSHVAHIETDVEEGHRIVIASAGTATSSRGRLENRGVNFYNRVCVWPDRFTVEERRFAPDGRRFHMERASSFDRTPAPLAEPV
jgi:3',5'-cyclic AMP phosphodiesterase CpdA